MKEYIIVIGDEPDIMGNYALKEKPKELVRCKDCKHGRIYENCVKCENAGNPGMFATYHRFDWFCADGERK